MDFLSDISEEDPFGEADCITLDSLERLSTGETPEQGPCDPGLGPLEAPPEPDCPPAPEKPLPASEQQPPQCTEPTDHAKLCPLVPLSAAHVTAHLSDVTAERPRTCHPGREGCPHPGPGTLFQADVY